jgi:hypothetical protein
MQQLSTVHFLAPAGRFSMSFRTDVDALAGLRFGIIFWSGPRDDEDAAAGSVAEGAEEDARGRGVAKDTSRLSMSGEKAFRGASSKRKECTTHPFDGSKAVLARVMSTSWTVALFVKDLSASCSPARLLSTTTQEVRRDEGSTWRLCILVV